MEHLIELLNNNQLFRNNFKPYFSALFPSNSAFSQQYLYHILIQCSNIRNTLYHANGISVRQVEKAVCYSNDIIDSIKDHYKMINLHNDFNAPSIISFSDSLGNKIYPKDLNENRIRYNRTHKFRVGDRIKMKIEIDASFEANTYRIDWYTSGYNLVSTGDEYELLFDKSWIGSLSILIARVISDKDWHRYTSHDDELGMTFTVLPLID